jgi:hypothetical protein
LSSLLLRLFPEFPKEVFVNDMHIQLKSLFQKLQAFYTMKEEYKNIGLLFNLAIRNKEELSRKRGVQCVGLQRNL